MNALRHITLIVMVGVVAILSSGCPKSGPSGASRPLPDKPGDGGLLLRYGFASGDRFLLRTEVDTRISVASDDPSASALLASMTDTRQTLTLSLSQGFDDGETDAGLAFTAVLEEIALDMFMGGKPMSVPAEIVDGLRGMTVRGITDRRGQLRDVRVTGAGLPEGMDPDRFADQIARSAPVLPEAPLEVGESFESLYETEIPGGDMLGSQGATMSVRSELTLREVAVDFAGFDISIEVTGTADEADGGLLLKGEGSGTARFDRKGGYFSELRVDQNVHLELTRPVALTMDLAVQASIATTPAMP